MLSNEQCIEVAKLWGFVKKWDDQDKRMMWFHYENEDVFEDQYLQEEVNSWSGFGRTVEAMSFKLGSHRMRWKDDSVVHLLNRCVQGIDSMDSLIPETHLAALEAIKEIEDDQQN